MARHTPRQHTKQYRRVWDPAQRKMVLLHRQLVAELLGRPLRPEEVVHHRDGNGLNNALENLEVLPDQRHHVYVEYHQKRWRGGQLPLSPDWLPAVALSQSRSVREGEGQLIPLTRGKRDTPTADRFDHSDPMF